MLEELQVLKTINLMKISSLPTVIVKFSTEQLKLLLKNE